ncbi:beta-1,6-N-acetylglucosaminyltransferase [soil metagenome]
MAIIIMAYKDPEQIKRLVTRMNHPSFDFYIHVDKKINIEPFLFLGKMERVFIATTRYEIIWAGYSLVKAMLSCTKEIMNSRQHYDFISTFSGQDYPLQPINSIVDYYSQRLGHSFFSLEDDDSSWWSHAVTRVNKYHFTDFKFRGRYKFQYLVNRILPKRTFPIFKKLYGGPCATFWTMSHDCAGYVIDFLEKNMSLRRFAKFTWACDEFLIPTIVMNSHFRNSVINDNGRYIDWSRGGSNPKILGSEDFDQIMSSGKLYARKFDLKVDTKILDEIDQSIVQQH